jgi:hypothetical protein
MAACLAALTRIRVEQNKLNSAQTNLANWFSQTSLSTFVFELPGRIKEVSFSSVSRCGSHLNLAAKRLNGSLSICQIYPTGPGLYIWPYLSRDYRLNLTLV